MKNQEIRISEGITPEVLELASRYYANYTQSYSEAELVAAGKEVQIPAEFIQRAIQEVQAKQQQQLEQQKQTRQQRQKLLKISAGIIAVLALWNIWTYNYLSSAALQTEAAWAQVENQLQRRADLIPNLVNITQNYARQEQDLISLLIQSRAAYLQAATPQQKTAAMQDIERAIARFQQSAAGNPQLQSSQLFINLQYELAGTENRLAVERMRYNQAVTAYNQKIQGFPNSFLAIVLGFQEKPFFKATKVEPISIPQS